MDSFNLTYDNKMSDDYESLLENGKPSDVVLVVGDKELRVHKQVLSARSPVFAVMFAHESTKEAQENRVEIIDIDVEVLKLLIKYIYTGDIKLDMLKWYEIADLFAAADKYQVDCLKSICIRLLLVDISDESVSELLLFADIYSAELYSKCFDYITRNYTEVMASKGWNNILDRVYFLAKLCEQLLLKYYKLTHANVDRMKAKAKKKVKDNGKNASIGPDLDFEKYLLKHSNVINWNEEATDAVLVVGDKVLKVHKLVLSTRSPVLAAMFAQHSTKEEQDCRVEITNVSMHVLKLLIKYIYTGKVDGLDRYATAKLFVAAEKYQVDNLKSICQQNLLSLAITTKSVSDLLILADMIQVTELYNKCLDYMADNRTEVIASPGWKMIQVKVDLLAKICDSLNLNISKQLDLCPITAKSVSNLLIHADMHQMTNLTTRCLYYIIGYSIPVMASKGWKQLLFTKKVHKAE